MTALSITGKQIADVLNEVCNTDHLPGLYFTDRNYAVADINHLMSVVNSKFDKWLDFLGLGYRKGQSQYWQRKFDCENLAELYKSYCDLLHYKTNPLSYTENSKSSKKNISDAEGLAVGVVWYDTSDSTAHAINVAISKDVNGKLKLFFIEPNTGRSVNLTSKDKEAIWYVKF